jgi:hypothetical protein
MYVGLHVKYRLFLSDFNETCFDETCFDETCFDETCFDETCFDETCFDETCFDETCFLDRFFSKLKYQISRKYFQWEPSYAMRTDRRTNMAKLTVAFRNFAKAPYKSN